MRSLLFWMVRVPIGVVGRVSGCLLAAVILGILFTLISWTLSGTAGVVLAIAAMFLAGLGIGWWRGRRAGPRSIGGAKYGRPIHALIVAVLITGVAGASYAWFPVRRAAVWSLWLAGRQGVPLLVRVAAGDDREVNSEADNVLAALGPKAEAAVPALVSGAHGGRAIEVAGPRAVGPLLTVVDDNTNVERRLWAIDILGRIHGTSEAVPALVRAYDDSDSKVSNAAGDALSKLGKDAAPALMLLAPGMAAIHPGEAYETPSKQIVLFFQIARQAGPDAAPLVPELIRLGPMARSGRRPSQKMDDFRMDEWERNYLYHADEALGAVGSAAVHPLHEVLLRPNLTPMVLCEVCDSLATIGPAAHEAVVDIRPLLKHSEVSVRLAAAKALWRIDGDAKTAVDMARKELNGAAIWQARDLLKDLGPKAAAALPDYLEMLKADDADRQIQGVELLAALGPEAAPAVGPLTDLLGKSKEARIRGPIFAAFRKIGPAAKPAVPALVAASSAPDDPADKNYYRGKPQLMAAVAAMEISGDARYFVDYLPAAIDKAAATNPSFTKFDEESDAIEAAVKKFPAQARAFLPSVNRAFRLDLMLPGQHERIVYAIGGVPAWLLYTEGAWILWIIAAILVAFVIEVAVYGWGWKRRPPRADPTA